MPLSFSWAFFELFKYCVSSSTTFVYNIYCTLAFAEKLSNKEAAAGSRAWQAALLRVCSAEGRPSSGGPFAGGTALVSCQSGERGLFLGFAYDHAHLSVKMVCIRNLRMCPVE